MTKARKGSRKTKSAESRAPSVVPPIRVLCAGLPLGAARATHRALATLEKRVQMLEEGQRAIAKNTAEWALFLLRLQR